MILASAALLLQLQLATQGIPAAIASNRGLPPLTVASAPRTASGAGPSTDLSADESSEKAKVPTASNPSQPAGASGPASFKPDLPQKPGQVRSPHDRRVWYALIALQHGGATFDARTTRDGIQSGQRQEFDPLLRPFSHSNAIYGAIQVAPAFVDFVGYRMMGSQHRWMRRIWWLPQAGGAALYFWSGVHNLRNSR